MIFIPKILKGHNSVKNIHFSAHRLIVVSIPRKFHETILDRIKDIERT